MNSCYLCHLHSCVISLLSQTHSASLFKLLYICFGESIRCLKTPAFRVEGRTFSVVNVAFPMVWRTPWKNAAGPACRRNTKQPAEWEKVGDKMADEKTLTVAPSSFLIRIFWELTHLF